MTKIKNTERYRICREKKGFQFGKPISSEIFKNKSEVIKAKCKIQKEDMEWEYYCEEEVIYEKSHSDEKGRQFDSAPTWLRINE